MKTALKNLLFVGLLCFGTSASAVEIVTWFTLSDTTSDQPDQVCVNGCTGSLTIDLDQAASGGIPNQYVVTDIDITLDSTPQLSFTTIAAGSATVVDNRVTEVRFALTTADYHYLVFNAMNDGTGDWTLGGPWVKSGGSGVSVPEPTSIALLGVGLLGLGLAGRRESSRSAV